MVLSTENGGDFIALMKRYVVDYTNSHDFAQTETIMEPDYKLFMGEHQVTGRDDAYRNAALKQMEQFPGLGLTVHEIATSGERLVMRFSEHGASRAHDGRRCAWGGIGLYLWNGTRLVSNFVEQDYFARRRQLKTGIPAPVEQPAIAPWDTEARPPVPAVEQLVREWLASGQLATTPGVLLDDSWTGAPTTPLIDQQSIEVEDLFSCGDTVAFRVKQIGHFIPSDGINAEAGTPCFLHAVGLVHIEQNTVHQGRVIRNRLDLARRMDKR